MNNNILLLHPGFDTDSTGSCDLLISLGEDNYAYAVVDHNTKEIRVIFDQQSVPDAGVALAKRIDEDNNLQGQYRGVKMWFSTAQEMLVPEAFSMRNSIRATEDFFNHTGSTFYMNEAISGFTPVFSAEKGLDALFEKEIIANAKKFHRIVPSLRLSNADGLYITLGASSAYFLFINDGKVIFQNQYQVEDNGEFCYYLLLVLNTLNIDGKATAVMINGLINQGDERYSILQQYFKQVNFVNPPSQFRSSELLENLPLHYFSALLALDLCE